jgi:hypothetical protein
MESNRTALSHGRGPHGAAHPPWAFRREAAIWIDHIPVEPNMIPVATEMLGWLKRERHEVAVLTEIERAEPHTWTNPYTYHASSLGVALSAVINDAAAFSRSDEDMDALDAEVQRIRLHTELVLYSARFCEAAIKQMLFCTSLPRRFYKRASLGQLLAIDCDVCRKAEQPTHDISLLGALAHRYYLCHELEGCVIEHLQLVARRRNLEVAHSDTLSIHPRTASASRQQMSTALDDIVGLFAHMLEHIAKIEQRMMAENNLFLRRWGRMPSLEEFMRIPARPPEALIEAAKAAMDTGPTELAAASEPD